MTIKELTTMRTKLEEEYDKLEKEINSYSLENVEKINELVSSQDIIDSKIDTIDEILLYLDRIKKLEKELEEK